MRLIIQKSEKEKLWLDEFDGQSYEWTPDKSKAWRFQPMAGEAKLFRLKPLFPEAFTVEVK